MHTDRQRDRQRQIDRDRVTEREKKAKFSLYGAIFTDMIFYKDPSPARTYRHIFSTNLGNCFYYLGKF